MFSHVAFFMPQNRSAPQVLTHFGAVANLKKQDDMRDYTLLARRNARNNGDASTVYAEDNNICSIPHCEGMRADKATIKLCERHIQKAWAAYQLLQGFAQDPEPAEIETRDVTSLQAKGTLYVVRVGELIKIGWTSRPQERMRSLGPDAILHYRAGTKHDEAKLHAKFVDHLAKGKEWFHLNDETLALIKELQSPAKAA